MPDLHWADTFVLIVIGVSALFGLFRGLVRELLSLAGWLAAGTLAYRYAGPLARNLDGVVSVPSVALALAFLAVLVTVLVGFAIVSYVVSRLVESTGLGATDRLLGVAFGVLRGGAVITVLVLLAGLTPVPHDPWWRESMFLPRFEQLAKLAIAHMPPEFGGHFDYDPPPGARRPGPPTS